MPSPAGPSRLLADLARGFARLSVDWYVFGAQAALLWGRPRMTTDVDVTARLGPVETTGLVAALGQEGFALRISATPAFVTQARVLPMVHEPTGFAVDIVLAGPGLEDEFLARAVAVDIGGVSVPVISPEDLIVTKVLAGRAKDIEDIRGVLFERGARLDLARVQTVLQMLEEALGQNDLLPLFEAEVQRWRQTLPARDEA